MFCFKKIQLLSDHKNSCQEYSFFLQKEIYIAVNFEAEWYRYSNHIHGKKKMVYIIEAKSLLGMGSL